MDVEKFWIYVVLAVIYGLSRMLKKNTKKPGDAPRKQHTPKERTAPRHRDLPPREVAPSASADPVRRPEPPKRQPKPTSFEELMREIMEAKTMPPRQEPVVDYDDQIGEEERSLEDVNYDDRRESELVTTYDRAKKEAFSRPSLEETMKLGDTVVSFGKFKEFERTNERNLAEEYLNDFSDMDKVRKAVVMSEILKPKF